MTTTICITTHERLIDEIDRFVTDAVRQGICEQDYNRRTAIRIVRECSLIAVRLDCGPAEAQAVTLRDISADGLGFFCDSGFPVGSVIAVRLSRDPESPWIPARVRHTRINQEGILVGVRFAVNDPFACQMASRCGPSGLSGSGKPLRRLPI